MPTIAAAYRQEYVQRMDITPAISVAAPMSSRLVVMMTPADKAEVEARARARDMTTSEFVRQAAAAYDERVSPEEERLLETLVDEFVAVVADMSTVLRQTNDRLDDHFAAMEAIRAAPPPVIDLDDDQLAALRQVFWAASEVPA